MKEKGRLTRSKDYMRVYRQDNPWVSPLLVMRTMRSGLEITRYGFTISKKVGTAVARNKIKRRLNEVLSQLLLCSGWDIVFTVRPAAAGASFSELKKSAEGLLIRAQLLMGKNEKLCLKAN